MCFLDQDSLSAIDFTKSSDTPAESRRGKMEPAPVEAKDAADTFAIVVAAGKASRYGGTENKVFLPLCGHSVLWYSLRALFACPRIAGVVLVHALGERPKALAACEEFVCCLRPSLRISRQVGAWSIGRTEPDRTTPASPNQKPLYLTEGGPTRAQSVKNGLAITPPGAAFVAVQDAARPLLNQEILQQCFDALDRFGSAVAASPAVDSLKRVGEDSLILENVSRENLWNVQTPQMFRLAWLKKAYAQPHIEEATDDASLVAAAGFPVHVARCSNPNRKLTQQSDFPMLRFLLENAAAQKESPVSETAVSAERRSLNDRFFSCIDEKTAVSAEKPEWAAAATPSVPEADKPEESASASLSSAADLCEEEGGSPMRVGIGYDVHRLVEGRTLILLGVKIDSRLGLLGHSDADVAAHALMDALLGAAGLGDIGMHFPDTDPSYCGADSMELMQKTVRMLAEKGYRPAQADVLLIAQRPKLSPYRAQMRSRLAGELGLSEDFVNVKFTTTEGLGFEGRGEGISAQAVAMIVKIDALGET